jgi:hypothetical protein
MNQCTLRANHARDFGGGLYCESADVLVDRSTIDDNSAGNNPSAYGGGICAVDSQLELIDSTIAGNSLYVFNTFSSSTARGGGVYLDNTDAMLEGNLIVNNEVDANGNVGTDGDGGGLALLNADPMLLNNTFSNNLATVNGGPQPGGALWCYQSDPILVNTIFWGDSAGEIEIDEFGVMSELTISYCDLEGGEAGIVTNDNALINFLEGNIDDDPMFVDAADGDYNLMEDSPCIDAGDPMSPLDPDGTVADIGALYFDQGVFGDVNGDGVVNTADLLQLLADWGPCPDCPSDLNGDGVVDTADLLALLAAWG